eukprot:5343667-Ditylum_brightwellii.AAC.1
MKIIDAHEQKDCILDCNKGGEKVIERVVAAIEHSSIDGVLGPLAHAIDATKLRSVTEASAGYMSITGVDCPNKLIDIKGMTKEDVHELFDVKLDKYGMLLAATEVTAMTFQHTPAGVSPTEIVVAHPQSNNEPNEFIKDMDRLVSSAVQLSGAKPRLLPTLLWSEFHVKAITHE